MNSTVTRAENKEEIKLVKQEKGIEEYRLSNGLKVILKPNLDVPLFSWQLWYKVGSRNEAPNYTGIAHYLEHIMFKGTKQFRKGEIAQIIQLKGGIFNAFTGDDYTAYFENFSPENLELAIKLEADRMQNSRIDPQEVDLERSVIVSELEGNRNSPTSLLYENLRANTFKVHTYRNPIIGWREDLDNIDAKAIRNFYETYYYPDNAVAILVGNFDKVLALDLIQKYFGKYKARDKELPKVPQEPVQNSAKNITIKNSGTTKLLGIGFHIPEFSADISPALSLLADIVFNGLHSRLYSKLVDTGLVTGISGYAESSIDPSIFRVIANLNPEADIKKVEQIIYQELDAIKQKITKEELKLAKASEESDFVYQLDGVYDEAMQIGYFEALTNDWSSYHTWLDKVKKVKAKDIKEAAKKYFVESNKTVVYLLPEEPSSSLTLPKLDPKKLGKKIEANYGSATVEPLDTKKLKRLLKISEPNYSKIYDFPKPNLLFKAIESKNKGWRLYFKEDHNLPLVYGNIYLYAGNAQEAKPGLAYFTSKMLARGSKKHDKYEISKFEDLYGADISFDVGIETAKIHFSSISKNLGKVVDLLEEILQEPAFTKAELDKLKIQTISSIKQGGDNLKRIANRKIAQMIYPKDHPYYIESVEEKIKAIESITIKDIKNFYQQNYNPRNLFVSMVGDINEKKAKTIVTKLFAKLNSSGAGNIKPTIADVKLNTPKTASMIRNDKTQSEIVLAHSGNVSRSSPDFHPLYIANYALGGSALSSLLGAKVRDENGLAYNIRSSFGASLGAGKFQVVLGCNPKNVTKAIALTKDVIKKFLKEGISKAELEATKSYLIGSFAVRTLASNEQVTETLAQMLIYDLGDDYIKTYVDRINAITVEQVNAAARKYIHPDKFNVVIAGPKYR